MEEEIRVVMIGKTGVGKSFLGNNILGKDIFNAEGCSQSVTTKLTRGERGIGNHCKIVLIDTPGLFDTNTNDIMKTAKIIVSTVKETKPGPHVFIFVISISNRFTAEEKAAVEFLKDLFGKHVTDYLIIVFTRKDDLDYGNKNLETYINAAGDDLKLFVSQCEGKMAINNRASDEEVTESVDSLIQMIKGVYLKNEKRHYTNELLAEAETIFKEKLCHLEEEAHRRERELEAEMKKLGEEKDLIITQHKTEFKEYQDKQQLEKEKLQEYIRKEKEQNNIFLRKQEEAHRRKRELEEEKDLLQTQHKTEFKKYQDKQQLEEEKLQEYIRKEKEQNNIFQLKQEEAHRRERELEAEMKKLGEEKDLIITQHKTEFKKYQDKQQLEKEKLQEDIRKEKEQNNTSLNKQEQVVEISNKIESLTEEKDKHTTELLRMKADSKTEMEHALHTRIIDRKKNSIKVLSEEVDKLNIIKNYIEFGHDTSFRRRIKHICTIQ